MDKTSLCIWYDRDAEEAANFYCSLFPDSGVDAVSRSPSDFPGGKAGDVLTVEFHIGDSRFMGLNGHSKVDFTYAMSIVVDCDDQAEVDKYWDALGANGGKPSQCGWIQDRWGVQWQITPRRLTELMKDPDRARAKRAMDAMMDMVKLDIAAIEAAARG